jgi:small nuclear ribonucleoprotein (snRNP)-like protein
LQIEVLLPNNEKTVGTLEHYSLQYNVALISVKNYNAADCVKLALNNICIQHKLTVVAVGRCFESGLLMAASGKYAKNSDVPDDLYCDYLWYTTCKTTKVAPLPFLF